MANPLLVTTDFSGNSRSAVRFAIEMAEKTNRTLIFLHCLPYLRLSRWTDAQYQIYAKEERKDAEKKLTRFVSSLFRSAGVKDPQFECIVKHSVDVHKTIVQQAKKAGVDAVCMGARGTGKLRKILGTTSTAVIKSSPIPVFVIPASYRRKPLKHIIYASDLEHIASELKEVRKIARPIKAKITVLHYDYLIEVKQARERLQKVAKKYKRSDVKFQFKKYHIDKSLASHLLKDIQTSKAQLVVLFTTRRRGWFDRLFLSSKSLDVAASAKMPLLIIPRD